MTEWYCSSLMCHLILFSISMYLYFTYVLWAARYAAFTPAHNVARKHVSRTSNLYPDTYYVDGYNVDGYKLLVRDTCRLYLSDIITIHLCHGRLVYLCIQQQTGDKLATILSLTQDTCRRRQVDTTCILQHISCYKRGIRDSHIFSVYCPKPTYVHNVVNQLINVVINTFVLVLIIHVPHRIYWMSFSCLTPTARTNSLMEVWTRSMTAF